MGAENLCHEAILVPAARKTSSNAVVKLASRCRLAVCAAPHSTHRTQAVNTPTPGSG